MGQLFPEQFYWGAATASYQVEGGIKNCDWAEAARKGKVPPCGSACDHYRRYERDFDIAKELGHNAHRLSIEWSRIEPEEGKFDERELEHYRAVLRALRSRGIEPFVTLWHFTLPLWFSESGGFLRRDAAAVFARYCRHVLEKLGGDADFWITENEPEVFAGMGYLVGIAPPFRHNLFAYLTVLSALAEAHRAAYAAIKSIRPSARVGIAKHNIFFESNSNPFNRMLHKFADWFWNHRFLESIGRHQDFVGLNQYHHRVFGNKSREREASVPGGFGCDWHRDSLYECCLALKRYGRPVYILENGVVDATDDFRPAYIRNAVACVQRALQADVPVKGYFHWTLLDNYEWCYGFNVRMGLVAVDRATMERRVRPSAYVYKRIIEECRTIDLVKKSLE